MAPETTTFSFDQIRDHFNGDFPSPMTVKVVLRRIDAFGQTSNVTVLECTNPAPGDPVGATYDFSGADLVVEFEWSDDSDIKELLAELPVQITSG